jgi:integrase
LPKGTADDNSLPLFLPLPFQNGELQADLASSVPAVADWRLSTVPKYLLPDEVDRVLGSCDRQASTGRRDYLITKYTALAGPRCASLKRKKVSPHVLRHAAAMDLLQNGVDRAVIALWLGHESDETTQMYLHADMRLKEQALSRTQPSKARPGRYRPNDKLLAFLESL